MDKIEIIESITQVDVVQPIPKTVEVYLNRNGLATAVNAEEIWGVPIEQTVVSGDILQYNGTSWATLQGYVKSDIDSLLAAKSDTSHLHDDRYYTETEINTLLSAKSDISHTHDDRYYTESETNTFLDTKLTKTGDTATGAMNFFPSSNVIPLSIKQSSGGTSDLLRLYDQNTILLSGFDSGGRLGVGMAPTSSFMLDVTSSSASVGHLRMTMVTSQSAAPITVRNSSLTTVFGVNSSGKTICYSGLGVKAISTDSAECFIVATGTNTTLATARTATGVPFTVRGLTSQTGDLFQAQDVANTVVGSISSTGSAYFTGLDVNASKLRVRSSSTPSSATATGNAGEVCWDGSYIYVCTATNTWRRVAHATW